MGLKRLAPSLKESKDRHYGRWFSMAPVSLFRNAIVTFLCILCMVESLLFQYPCLTSVSMMSLVDSKEGELDEILLRGLFSNFLWLQKSPLLTSSPTMHCEI